MPSLRQLIHIHRSLLLLDTASNRIQVGLLSKHHESRWASAHTEAGTGLFSCIDELGINPTSVAATILCSGPGSILGIRTAAMAIRTWNAISPRIAYSYHSLNLVSTALGDPEANIIADARREHWHSQTQGKPMQQIPANELSGRLLIPEGFRHWSSLPQGTITTSYDVEVLMRQADDADLFTSTDNPDAFLHTEPSYKQWIPQIHRTP